MGTVLPCSQLWGWLTHISVSRIGYIVWPQRSAELVLPSVTALVEQGQLSYSCYLRVNSSTCLRHLQVGLLEGQLYPAHAAMWQMRDGARLPMLTFFRLAHLCSHQQSHLCCAARTMYRLTFPCVVAGQGVTSITISACSLPLLSLQICFSLQDMNHFLSLPLSFSHTTSYYSRTHSKPVHLAGAAKYKVGPMFSPQSPGRITSGLHVGFFVLFRPP